MLSHAGLMWPVTLFSGHVAKIQKGKVVHGNGHFYISKRPRYHCRAHGGHVRAGASKRQSTDRNNYLIAMTAYHSTNWRLHSFGRKRSQRHDVEQAQVYFREHVFSALRWETLVTKEDWKTQMYILDLLHRKYWLGIREPTLRTRHWKKKRKKRYELCAPSWP